MEIHGSVIIVTGASEGIGEAAARVLARNGARLALAARSSDKLARLRDELQASGAEVISLPTDMRDKEAVARMIADTQQHFGRIDALINNAGQSVGGTIEKLNLDDFQSVIDLNIFGVLHAMQAVIPVMRAQGGGLILNISSMVSKLILPWIGGYASTKSMLNQLSVTARAELAPDNIRVCLMFPRTTATRFRENGLNYSGARPRPGANIQVDSAEAVADRILLALKTEPAEQYMQDSDPVAQPD